MTGVDIEYWKDSEQIVYNCYDGYANGSISTAEYYTIDGAPSTFDIYGSHNITISEWTVNKDPLGVVNADNPTVGTYYRVPETNECEVMSGTTTPRADYGEDADETILDAAIK